MDDTQVAKIDNLLLQLEHVFEATTYALENISAEVDVLRRELTSLKKASRKGLRRARGARQLRNLRKSG
jgi:hypothetical protein